MTPPRVFYLMGVVQFISYFNLTVNFRAIDEGRMLVAMGTDALAVIISIFVVQRLANPEKLARFGWQEAGMVIGGSLAACAGMWLTRSWG